MEFLHCRPLFETPCPCVFGPHRWEYTSYKINEFRDCAKTVVHVFVARDHAVAHVVDYRYRNRYLFQHLHKPTWMSFTEQGILS